MKDDPDALSTAGEGVCECCLKTKIVRLYVLANLETAFVCQDCRAGKKG